MERLSGLDSAFLSFETPAMHLHVAIAAVIDPSTMPAAVLVRPAQGVRVRAAAGGRHLPPPGRGGAVPPQPPDLGRGSPPRPRLPHPAPRAPHAGRAPRAHRPGRLDRRRAARPVAAAVGDPRHRGPPRRQRGAPRQDPPRRGRRRVRRRAVRPPVRPDAHPGAAARGRRAARAGADPVRRRAGGPRHVVAGPADAVAARPGGPDDADRRAPGEPAPRPRRRGRRQAAAGASDAVERGHHPPPDGRVRPRAAQRRAAG